MILMADVLSATTGGLFMGTVLFVHTCRAPTSIAKLLAARMALHIESQVS